MNNFKNILLFIDSKTKSNNILEYVEFLAKKNTIKVTVFSVVEDLPADMRMAITMMPPQQLLEQMLASEQEHADGFAKLLNQRGIEATAHVATGTPFIETIRQVLRNQHDLVMMMAEGKGGIKDRLFGTTSMHLMRKCPCPVWVIKPTKHANYKRILAAVDITADDSEQESLNQLIVRSVTAMSSPESTKLHVVQVWTVFGEGYLLMQDGSNSQSIKQLRREVKQQYQEGLTALLADFSEQGLNFIKHFPKSNNPPKAIVNLAKKEKIDLLVMGTVCRTGVAGFLIGNTAEKVLDEVNCSVLTVKPEGFVTPVTLAD